MLAEAFPRAPVIVVICDNDSIHHARKVTAYLKEPPGCRCLRRPLQSGQQPGRTDLGGAEELRGEHPRELARPPPAESRFLPQPLPAQAPGPRPPPHPPLAPP